MRLRERTMMRSRYGDDCVAAGLAGWATGCPAVGRSSRPARTSGTRASVCAGAVACGRTTDAGVNERPFRVIFGPPEEWGGTYRATPPQGCDTRNLLHTDTKTSHLHDARRPAVLVSD